jgi:ornithine--oxo-acid transaminase
MAEATKLTKDTSEYLSLEETWGAPNYHPLNVVVERAEGPWVYSVEGKRYLDCLSAYSAVNQGHCHPRILETLREQAGRLTLTSRAFRNDQWPLFAKELAELCGMQMVLPVNTGAEAVETAIKAARRWGYRRKGIASGRAEIIVCANNFHGRSTTIVGFSSDALSRDDFGPFTPGFVSIPFGDAGALEKAITPNTCAFLVEPIQCEAGIFVPPDGYLSEARRLCSQHNVLLLADEIQTGLGRTGKLFGCDHDNVKPDVFILGKALSGGFYPVSAVVSSRDVLEVFEPGSHGSTYGGNPLGCAVARTALRVLLDEHLTERSAELGAWFLAGLQSLRHPQIKQIRGRGLLVGIELHVPARPYCERLEDEGLLCKETHENVIRLAPPLVTGRDELAWALDRLRTVFSES